MNTPQLISKYTAKKMQAGDSVEMPAHLIELYQKSTEGLNDEQKESVAQLLGRFQDSFSRDERDLGLTHLTAHAIRTEGAAPIKQPPRRVPMAYAKDEKRAIDDLKAKGVIRDSSSPWATQLFWSRRRMGESGHVWIIVR